MPDWDAVLDVRGEKIVADDLDAAAEFLEDQVPAIPIRVSHGIFDGDDGIAATPVFEQRGKFDGRKSSLFEGESVFASLLVKQIAGGDIQEMRGVFARAISGQVSMASTSNCSASSLVLNSGQ